MAFPEGMSMIESDPLEACASLPPYESLSYLCTMLAISDFEFIPLDQLIQILFQHVKEADHNGDILVMAARSLALYQGKFFEPMSSLRNKKSKRELTRCLELLFAPVVQVNVLQSLVWTQCSQSELTEELLKCTRVLATADESFSIPPPEHQIAFCQAALDGASWTSCVVSRHLSFLMRQKKLTEERAMDVQRIFLELLKSLCVIGLDSTWDELLRCLTECVVTYHFWAPHPRNFKMDTEEIEVFCSLLSIPKLDTTEARLSLVLACVNAVSSLGSSSLLTRETTNEAVCHLLHFLDRHSSVLLRFSDPFTQNANSTTIAEGTENPERLANLQWNVPDFRWSAVCLIGRLLGGRVKTENEYLWAWQDLDGEYHAYDKAQRELLSAAFHQSKPTFTSKNGRRIIHLTTMRDASAKRSFEPPRAVHFQPIPFRSTFVEYEAPPMVPPVKGKGAPKENLIREISKTLRNLSLGTDSTAELSKILAFHLLRYAQPNRSEETVTTLRNLITPRLETQLEHYANLLLLQSKEWSYALHDAGITDAIKRHFSATPPSKDPFQGRKRRRETPLPNRVSPVVQILEAGGEVPPSSVLLPSHSTPLEFLQSASVANLMAFFETTEIPPWTDDEIITAIDQADHNIKSTVSIAVHALLLKQLQDFSISAGVSNLSVLLDRSRITVAVCSKLDSADFNTTSLNIKCDMGHPLKLYSCLNWKCNSCKKSSRYPSLACRICNLDYCKKCIERGLGLIQTNKTATVNDLMLHLGRHQRSSSSSFNVPVLTHQSSVLSPTCPVSTLTSCRGLHFGFFGESCKCKTPLSNLPTLTALPASSLFSRVSTYTLKNSSAPLNNNILYAVINTLSSYSCRLFEYGVSGLPDKLVELIQALTPFFPTAFQYEVFRFLSIDVRRFALQQIQVSGFLMGGSVPGEAVMNSVAYKVRTSRSFTAESIKRFGEQLGACTTLRNKLEFVLEGEEGTGTGPTQEFYSEICNHFASKRELWYTTEESALAAFPTNEQLFETDFFVMGAILGRAFIDGYITELELSPLVWAAVLRAPSLHRSDDVAMVFLREYQPTLTNSLQMISTSSNEELESMGIFDDNGEPVTTERVNTFVQSRVESATHVAVKNLAYFILGVFRFLEPNVLQLFSAEDLTVLFGGGQSDDSETPLFSEDELRAAVVEAHGYGVGSTEVQQFISIVGSELNRVQQRQFLEFISGSGRLPPNGLAGLGRKITVARKEMEGKGEGTLPSCNTCFLYVKLPPYSTREIMKDRLLFAISEGRKYFSLS